MTEMGTPSVILPKAPLTLSFGFKAISGNDASIMGAAGVFVNSIVGKERELCFSSGGRARNLRLSAFSGQQLATSYFKTHFSVILNEVKDLNSL
ncbi:MAG: hypothetical protein AB1491_03430 [Thermodesulfobacteriota bacterium]